MSEFGFVFEVLTGVADGERGADVGVESADFFAENTPVAAIVTPTPDIKTRSVIPTTTVNPQIPLLVIHFPKMLKLRMKGVTNFDEIFPTEISLLL